MRPAKRWPPRYHSCRRAAPAQCNRSTCTHDLIAARTALSSGISGAASCCTRSVHLTRPPSGGCPRRVADVASVCEQMRLAEQDESKASDARALSARSFSRRPPASFRRFKGEQCNPGAGSRRSKRPTGSWRRKRASSPRKRTRPCYWLSSAARLPCGFRTHLGGTGIGVDPLLTGSSSSFNKRRVARRAAAASRSSRWTR